MLRGLWLKEVSSLSFTAPGSLSILQDLRQSCANLLDFLPGQSGYFPHTHKKMASVPSMRFRTGGFEIQSLPPPILRENGGQVPHPLTASSFCARHNDVVMWPKNKHPAAATRELVSFAASLRLGGRVADLYKLYLPIMVPFFSPQAHCCCTFNYSSLLPGNAVVTFLIYLSLLTVFWPPAGTNRFQQAPLPCSFQNGIWCDAATVLYPRKLGK